MRRKPKVGLLLLYLKLYDEVAPEHRAQFEPFVKKVEQALGAEGVEVAVSPVCRVKSEFAEAVASFESEGVDLIATLHLAYSPSLESVDALSATELPVLLLDTTMDYDFGPGVDPARIMYNHGIHGVQDLASLLRRRGRAYRIAAGHLDHSDVVSRAADAARAALAAKVFGGAKVLRIGESFAGMGDFAVEESVLRKVFGIEASQITAADLARDVAEVPQSTVAAEITLDRERFEADLDEEVHRRSVRVGLGLRNRLSVSGCSAFSMNFLAFDSAEGPVDTVPFLEASKAMARGMGYAGEGDVLTAALVGALSAGFGGTTFTEAFCPDWKGGAVFLSHMGEINPEVIAGKARLVEKPFPYTAALNPAVLTGAPAAGPAVFVNLVPGPADSFDLIAAPVEVLEDTSGEEMRETVRGWIRPSRGIEAFLEEYSKAGGTHHSALVLGEKTEALEAFAAFCGIGFRRI